MWIVQDTGQSDRHTDEVQCLLYSLCSFSTSIDTVGWVFLTCKKAVARITCTVLVETLNPGQSIKAVLIAAAQSWLRNNSLQYLVLV